MLNIPQGIDLTNDKQKLFAAFLIGLTLVALYYLLPPFIFIMSHLYIAIALALPLIYICMNPMVVWNVYKGLSFKLTKFLISKDKLGYMYRYHEYILMKIEKLKKSTNSITEVKTALSRALANADKEIKTAEQEERAATTQGKDNVARVARSKVATNTKLIESYGLRLTQVKAQESALIQLFNAWTADAEDLKYTLDAKAEEYQLLKTLNQATSNASEFLKGNSEEYKLYQESLNQIEDSVVKFTANIESFERDARPLIDRIEVKQQANEEAGLKIIEEYRNKGKINFKEAIQVPQTATTAQ